MITISLKAFVITTTARPQRLFTPRSAADPTSMVVLVVEHVPASIRFSSKGFDTKTGGNGIWFSEQVMGPEAEAASHRF